MEFGWWNRNEDGKKYQVHLEVFGKKLRWRCQRARFEPWEDYADPTEDDWERALQMAENRFQRKLLRIDILELIRTRGEG